MKPASVVTALLALLVGTTSAHARVQVDASTGTFSLPKDERTVRIYDFESAQAIEGLSFVRRSVSGGTGALSIVPASEAFDPSMLTSGDDALEGEHALRLGTTGLLVGDPALFSEIRDGKFEATFWARSDGAGVDVQVYYDTDPTHLGFPAFASVRGVPTGRATNDGWAEFIAGPLDGSVWGVPAMGITVMQSRVGRGSDTSFLVDAFEIRKLRGEPTPEIACTQANVDAVCGAEGDCMFGHCVSSTVTWGLLPSPAQARAIGERWIHFATNLIGDRNAAARGRAIFEPEARRLIAYARSSRQFFGGLAQLVNDLRDNHTSFGGPFSSSVFVPQIAGASSSSLGACFGVVDKDLLGGGLGYAVFAATEKPLSKVPLRRGDVVTAIDGQEPKAWVDENWHRFASAMPNDPDADWGPSANDLSRLLATRASTVTLTRCASSDACGEGARETFTIPIGQIVHDAIRGGFPEDTSPAFACSQRFTNVVPPTGSGGDGSSDPVYTAIGDDGETRIQFDGFVADSAWKKNFSDALSPRPSKVVVDARMGHGGVLDAVQYLLDLTRGTSEPMGVIMLGRGTYEATDPPWLFTDLHGCVADSDSSMFWECFRSEASGSVTTKADPVAGSSRIAWLNTYDVSANDFMPRLLKGRSNFKIFAPHPTSGAFGAIITLPTVGINGFRGSIQIQDSRFADDLSTIASKRWESGHGVEPDVVVAEKLSDAIAGVDTIVETARTWLNAP